MVISCRGELDLSVSHQLEEKIDQLWTAGLRSITIDMTGVSFMDSSGVHCLLEIRKRCHEFGVRLELIPSEAVALVLKITGRAVMFDLSSARPGEAPRRPAGQPLHAGLPN